jgi:hypothetical protein
MRLSIIMSIFLVLGCICTSTSGYAENWCSFEPEKKSQLDCGYSTLHSCRQAARACLLDAVFG